MKISNIVIDGVGGIKHLSLSLHDGLNLICGTNGIGKTTILEAIAHFFTTVPSNTIKKHVGFNRGLVVLDIEKNGEQRKINYFVSNFEANRMEFGGPDPTDSSDVLVFRADRSFNYMPLASINADPSRDVNVNGTMAYQGINPNDIKSWFINRHTFSFQPSALAEEQKKDLQLAINSFSALDGNVTFSRVVPATFDIMVNTPQGEVYFEYLSSGYKSCIYILFGIIKEIEFRFHNPCVYVGDFDGIILIDELDLHLHPQWQSVFVSALKKMVPKAQIIATTHSPSMIQAALPDEIIPLAMDEANNIYRKDLHLGEYGLRGWTIEEILTYVMGLPSTNTSLYDDTMKAFDKAVDEEDIDKIRKYYNILNKMLHPDNPIRKIIEIQVAGWRNQIDKDTEN